MLPGASATAFPGCWYSMKAWTTGNCPLNSRAWPVHSAPRPLPPLQPRASPGTSLTRALSLTCRALTWARPTTKMQRKNRGTSSSACAVNTGPSGPSTPSSSLCRPPCCWTTARMPCWNSASWPASRIAGSGWRKTALPCGLPSTSWSPGATRSKGFRPSPGRCPSPCAPAFSAGHRLTICPPPTRTAGSARRSTAS